MIKLAATLLSAVSIIAQPIKGEYINTNSDITGYFTVGEIYNYPKKIEAFNTKSGKTVKAVTIKAVQRSQALILCKDNQELCYNSNTSVNPTPFPTPTPIPVPITPPPFEPCPPPPCYPVISNSKQEPDVLPCMYPDRTVKINIVCPDY